ncbi:MAG: hypothetical protein ACRDRO_30140 [Pseudonocardiaceae bacterium]
MIDWLGLDDYDLGGYSLGGRIVLRILVRGAREARIPSTPGNLAQGVKSPLLCQLS